MNPCFARALMLVAALYACALLVGCDPDPCPPAGFARFVCETAPPGTVLMRFGSTAAPVIHERMMP